MSRSTSKQNTSSPPAREPSEELHTRLVESAGPRAIIGAIRTWCFWVAIIIPFLYVPLLLTGIETPQETVAFLSLLVVNVLALVAGHAHGI